MQKATVWYYLSSHYDTASRKVPHCGVYYNFTAQRGTFRVPLQGSDRKMSFLIEKRMHISMVLMESNGRRGGLREIYVEWLWNAFH